MSNLFCDLALSTRLPVLAMYGSYRWDSHKSLDNQICSKEIAPDALGYFVSSHDSRFLNIVCLNQKRSSGHK